MDRVEDPVATVAIRWVSADEGGRGSEPPTATVYMATCQFIDNSPDQLRIRLQQIEDLPDGRSRYLAGPLAPALAAGRLLVGSSVLILDGQRGAGEAEIESLTQPSSRRTDSEGDR